MHVDPLVFQLASSDGSSASANGLTPSGLNFVYFAENIAGSTQPAIGIYAVSLPFIADIHLLGITKQNNTAARLAPLISTMQPVKLEGDYDAYFSLFVAGDEQMESRVLLDPAAMEYNIDFCAAYTWEICNNTLYFVSQGELPDLSVVDAFVKQLTPAVGTQPTASLIPKLQHAESLSPIASKLLCPLCSSALRAGHRWLSCPNGHGYLIKAADIVATRRHMNDMARVVKASINTPPSVITPVTAVDHGDLHCPNDQSVMEKSAYQETSAFLYTCTQCVYRWIDGKDLDIILGKYRNDGDDEPDNDPDNDSGTPGDFLMRDITINRHFM